MPRKGGSEQELVTAFSDWGRHGGSDGKTPAHAVMDSILNRQRDRYDYRLSASGGCGHPRHGAGGGHDDVAGLNGDRPAYGRGPMVGILWRTRRDSGRGGSQTWLRGWCDNNPGGCPAAPADLLSAQHVRNQHSSMEFWRLERADHAFFDYVSEDVVVRLALAGLRHAGEFADCWKIIPTRICRCR